MVEPLWLWIVVWCVLGLFVGWFFISRRMLRMLHKMLWLQHRVMRAQNEALEKAASDLRHQQEIVSRYRRAFTRQQQTIRRLMRDAPSSHEEQQLQRLLQDIDMGQL